MAFEMDPLAPVSPRPPTPMKQKIFLFSSYFCWGGDGSWWHWGSRWDQKPLREASWRAWLLLGDTRRQALEATAGNVAILRIMEILVMKQHTHSQPITNVTILLKINIQRRHWFLLFNYKRAQNAFSWKMHPGLITVDQHKYSHTGQTHTVRSLLT